MIFSRRFLLFALAFEATTIGNNGVSAIVSSNATVSLNMESSKPPVTTDSPTESPAPSPSPSANPSASPTGTNPPTGKPSAAPTESPAPSPSPSADPTNLPTTSPSASPSASPTRTMKPSSSPSSSPSYSPSASPSRSPSASPTISPQPSAHPSASPSAHPSASPTNRPSSSPSVSPKPSATPSVSPSHPPTNRPSASPTNVPTHRPSTAPSSSPTEEAFKTKSGQKTIVLPDIEREMSDTHLAHFEVTTMEFIRDSAPHTPGFDIQILAVTLLTQTAFYPDVDNNSEGRDNTQGERRMKKVPKASLEVSFQTIGVVRDGGAPTDFNFTKDIISYGFDNHMDEYLYRLSKTEIFFEPLKAHTDFKEAVDPHKRGQFIAAVVFSVIAFIVALLSSVYAIRRHMAAKRRRMRRKRFPELPGKSETYSSSTDEDENNNGKMPLQLEINNEFENVPITPRSIASPFKKNYDDEEAYPLSPGMRKEAAPSTSIFGETGEALKKWLTPRLSSPTHNIFEVVPGENGRPSARKVNSPDPIALKAGTDKPGIFGTTPLSIPLSFFNQGGDAESEASGTPMGSLAESAASSFFNRVGRYAFTGRESSESYLKARSKFSPPFKPPDTYQGRQPVAGIKEEETNDFATRTRSEPTKDEQSFGDESMKRHRTYDGGRPSVGSEVSDVRLNEIEVESKENMSSYYNPNTLGARALKQNNHYEDSSLSSVKNKPESYDVFAPSGPIGIVVDTSKNGPAVHSLKSTSPMLGLINPGDLIIGLDDEDTRKMTAASLTRLMAKKSRQKERKITLLSVDGF